MACDELSISNFMDGELPAAEARAVQAHLDACDSCQEALEAFMQIDVLAKHYFAEG